MLRRDSRYAADGDAARGENDEGEDAVVELAPEPASRNRREQTLPAEEDRVLWPRDAC